MKIASNNFAAMGFINSVLVDAAKFCCMKTERVAGQAVFAIEATCACCGTKFTARVDYGTPWVRCSCCKSRNRIDPWS